MKAKKKNLLIVAANFYGKSPKPTGPSLASMGYYSGPMRNKRGDLVTDDGKVIERAKTPPANSTVRME
jgi:hypothetical protein